MSIHKGKEGKLTDKVDQLLRHDEDYFMNHIWSVTERYPKKVEDFLTMVAPLEVFRLMTSKPKIRKRALKTYKKNEGDIMESIKNIERKKYPWSVVNEDTIYDKLEQEELVNLMLFFVTNGKKEVNKTKEIFSEVFVIAKKAFRSEKDLLKLEDGKEEFFNLGKNKMIDKSDLSKALTIASHMSNGYPSLLIDDEFGELNEPRYETFYIYLFCDKYISEFKYLQLIVTSQSDYKKINHWSLTRNFEYIAKNIEVSDEVLNDAYSLFQHDKRIKEKYKGNGNFFPVKDFAFIIADRMSILEAIEIFQKNVENEMRRVLYVKASTIAIKVKDSMAITADNHKPVIDNESYRDIEEEISKVGVYNEQINRVNAYLIASTHSKGGISAELLDIPLSTKAWQEVNKYTDLISFGFLADTPMIDEKEEEARVKSEQERAEAIYIILVQFVQAALLVAQKEVIKLKEKNFNSKKAKNSEKKAIEKLEKTVFNQKQELSQKDNALKNNKEELSALSDKVRKLSKSNSRLESLENQNEQLKIENEKLKKDLENQKPIIVEKTVRNTGVDIEKVLDKLNSPDEHVVMVGGHPALIAKVKQWSPNMDFIEPRDYSKEISSKATIVIMNVSYLNHAMSSKAFERIEKIKKEHNVQVVYLNSQSTNKDFLLKEIGEQLA